jgi:outer membrane lipoprotein-sorting protein
VSALRSRPALRWLVPAAAAAVVIGGGAAAGTIVASADPALPERSAAQLLVDLQNAKVEGLSGTIVQTADLGLPSLPGLTGGQSGTDLTSLVAGSNTARVWYAGEDKARVALVGVLGETDVIRNGSDVWIWHSRDNKATHVILPEGADEKPKALPTGVPSTPQEAADAALAAIDPTTVVSTTGAASVAGRDAYELVLAPRDTQSLIGQVRLAVDAKEHIPLRVDVYAKGANDPALRVAFQQISFTVPDGEQFSFNPPPGAEVKTERPAADSRDRGQDLGPNDRPKAAEPGTRVVGEGWTSVLVMKGNPATGDDREPQELTGLLGSLPKVSGSWGSGRLLSGALFSALLTDDGRVLVGAVAPETLYEVAKQK